MTDFVIQRTNMYSIETDGSVYNMKAVKILTPTFIALLVETPRMQKTKKSVGLMIFLHSR